MLFPDVWNFQAQSDAVSVFNLSSEQENSITCENIVKDHHLNHSVLVVSEGPIDKVKELSEFLTVDCDYYKAKLPLSQIVDKQFIDLFVREGELSALSIGTKIDVDNCAAIIPSGHLILSVARDTFHTLGLEGTPWPKSSLVKPERYAILIDLKKECFKPGKANYERVLKSFTEFYPLHFEFVFGWEPSDDISDDYRFLPEVTQISSTIEENEEINICPSSIAAFLSKKGHDVRVCSPKLSYEVQKKVLVPSMKHTSPHEVLEWLGAFSLGVFEFESSLDSNLKEFLTSYKTPSESCEVESVVKLQWTGFFTTKKILNLLSHLRSSVVTSSLDSNSHWTSLTVNGFSDSPLSWGMKQHTIYTSGHNDYTIFLQPDGNNVVFKVAPSDKRLKRKKCK